LTIAEMSQREGISTPNVAKIMRILRRAGLVLSTRGKSGGYTLARHAAEIPVSEALGALGGRLFDSQFCDRHAGQALTCANLGDCSIRPVLRHLQEAVDLGRLTLKSLLVTEQEMSVSMSPHAIALPLASRPS
jgi:Rrf2 family protein